MSKEVKNVVVENLVNAEADNNVKDESVVLHNEQLAGVTGGVKDPDEKEPKITGLATKFPG